MNVNMDTTEFPMSPANYASYYIPITEIEMPYFAINTVITWSLLLMRQIAMYNFFINRSKAFALSPFWRKICENGD